MLAEEEAEENVAPAHDTVGGHFQIAAITGWFVPFGSLQGGLSQSDVMDTGVTVGGDFGYGVSRTVMLGIYGEVGLASGASGCSGCNASSFAVGPLIRYHLVQGLSFDPWVSAGIGFRRASDGHDSWTGIDWARLAVGSEWYPWSNLGVGPLVELTLGTFFGSTRSGSSAAFDGNFTLGARVVFDGPGK
jgi:hypothetical protein